MRFIARLLGCLGLVALTLAMLAPSRANAQGVVVSPYFMIIVDTSGSMSTSTGAGNNSCGHPHTRLSDAKCVVENVLNAYGQVEFGLETYATTCTGGACTATCNQGTCGCTGCGLAFCDALPHSSTILAPIAVQNTSSIFNWVDYACAPVGGCTAIAGAGVEMRSAGNTPIQGSLRDARRYFSGSAGPYGADPVYPTSPLAADIGTPLFTCRPVSVILLTDGGETCGGTPANSATELRMTQVGASAANIKDIHTYAIGLGIPSPDPEIEGIATNGGTTRGYYATDEQSIALAFSQIISSSILYEICDNADNDCDMIVDEGFTHYCNRPSHPAQDLCVDPGEICDGIDNNCNGQIDEGFTLYCNRPGGHPARDLCANPGEVCNGVDDNCNGLIDEGLVGCTLCVPGVEICNNADDDCDMTIDENVTRGCGVNLGICTAGTQTCTAGVFGACSGTGPSAQMCNGLDNDCDGQVDRPVRPCGSAIGACVPGSQICNPATMTFGTCVGGVGPSPERCNNIDDNCNGVVDEGDPGGGGTCGSATGTCTRGVYHCIAGALTCQGGTSGTAEVCNNLDDDCDGLVDEGIPSGGTCGTSMVGQCMLGQLLCVAGVPNTCVGAVGPSPEVCDGIDNNCNGSVDEGNPGGGAVCGMMVGACRAGITMCVAGTLTCVGSTMGTPEVCNGIDDDCDSLIDEGIPVGAPCGSSIGVCMPGNFICNAGTGMLVCSGAISGMAEVCNQLDDDCDGIVDEDVGAGGVCGVNVGTCMTGTNQCVGGAVMCVGAIGPTVEICDCLDNNCDGSVDNPPTGGSLCPSGSACVMCQCASPCMHSEFGDTCPAGTVNFVQGGVCSCVAPACRDTTCATETHMSGAMVACSPTTDACVCRNNACTYRCEGVTCAGGLVCSPHTGACVQNNCVGLQNCGAGQVCDVATATCVTDHCAAVTCAANQACRSMGCDGTAAHCCFATCATATCTGTMTCHNGTCQPGCAGVMCPAADVCNPATGTCTINLCSGVSCPTGQTCSPIDGMCHGDLCIGVHCPAMTMCTAGECVRMTADAGAGQDGGPGTDSGVHTDGGGSDGGRAAMDSGADHAVRELVAGGACLCSAAGSGRGGLGAALIGLAVAGTFLLRRRGGERRRRGGAR